MNTEELRKELIRLIMQAEREKANALIDKWAETQNYREALIHLIEPVMTEIGSLWMREEASLAQGYVAGKVAEDIILKAYNAGEYENIKSNSRGPVVIGNIEDDYHSLGRRLVVTFLQAAGWHVFDLGNDVSAEEFVDTALDVGAKVIGVSAMMYTTASNIKKVRELLDRRKLSGRIQLAVGGAIFKLRPELLNEIGGDGTADSAINAPELFDRLWKNAQEEERRHE